MPEQPQFTIHPSATNLRAVTMCMNTTRPFFICGQTLNLPWAQLASLEINTCIGALDCIWDVLSRCISLHDLKILAPMNDCIPAIPITPQVRWQFNFLRSFYLVVNIQPAIIGFLLDALRLPLLETFDVSFLNSSIDPNGWPKEAIIALRERSVAPLKQVAVYGKEICQADLIDFATRMPTLEELVVENGKANLVTPAVIALLPQTEADIQQRRAAYDIELDRARQDGRRN